MASFRELFCNRRIALMLPLGFASGLPLALTGGTLAAWARESGISLTQIGILSLVAWPYMLKFLWAPLIDRYCPPFLDRRRSWMIVFQLLLILAIGSMAFFSPKTSPLALAAVAVCVAFFSASLDIPTDAYRTDILADTQRGPGSAIYVGGYRLGMIVSGGLALVLADKGFSWPAVYLTMAACMSVGLVATLITEPAPAHLKAPTSLDDAVFIPIRQFFLRPDGWLVIAFIILFKLPDITALSTVTTPFLLDIGFTKTDIGTISQVMGLAIGIVGALAGGILVGKIGLRSSLWIVGILHGIANIGFLILAHYPKSYAVLVGAISAEHFVAGLVGAAFTAFLMSQCDPRHSAFQFALLSACVALSRTIGTSAAGYLAQTFGWSNLFLIIMASAIPGMLLLPFLPLHPRPIDQGQPRGLEVIGIKPVSPEEP